MNGRCTARCFVVKKKGDKEQITDLTTGDVYFEVAYYPICPFELQTTSHGNSKGWNRYDFFTVIWLDLTLFFIPEKTLNGLIFFSRDLFFSSWINFLQSLIVFFRNWSNVKSLASPCYLGNNSWSLSTTFQDLSLATAVEPNLPLLLICSNNCIKGTSDKF